jgi:hypothetical protein
MKENLTQSSKKEKEAGEGSKMEAGGGWARCVGVVFRWAAGSAGGTLLAFAFVVIFGMLCYRLPCYALLSFRSLSLRPDLAASLDEGDGLSPERGE